MSNWSVCDCQASFHYENPVSSSLSSTETHRQVSCSLSGELWRHSERSSHKFRSWMKNNTNRSFWDDLKIDLSITVALSWNSWVVSPKSTNWKKDISFRWGLKTLRSITLPTGFYTFIVTVYDMFILNINFGLRCIVK